MNMSAMMGVGGGRMPDFSAVKEKMFQKADANGDKAVSFEEFQSAGKNMPIGKMGDASKAKEAFGKIDSDGNGSLSQDEMSAFGDKMSSQMQGMMLGMQAMLSSMGQGMGGKMGGSPDINAMFGKADSDKSGSISRAEFDKAGQGNPIGKLFEQNGDDAFGKIDSDGDGSLTKDEMQSFAETMKKQMEQKMGGVSQQSELMQAINAYRQGSGGSGTDLTKKLLEMLGSQKGAMGVTA
jgi:Ca2+-binding EF-hand superfamily protein